MPLSTLVYGHREPPSSPTHPGHAYHSALRVCKTWPLILTGILWEGQETALSISWSSVISATFPYLDTACLLFSFPPALPRLGGSIGKESACNVGDLNLMPGSGRPPGRGHSNPLQYSCLENLHGQRSLAGCSPWGCKESDMME